MRITLAIAPAVIAGVAALAAPQMASAMPAAGLSKAGNVEAQSAIHEAGFKRRPDGSMYYDRPNPNGEKTYYFAYKGYAYPYNPGYTYRLYRGELKPSDRLRRYRIAD